jgi:superfamily II DNA/RNA helicase
MHCSEWTFDAAANKDYPHWSYELRPYQTQLIAPALCTPYTACKVGNDLFVAVPNRPNTVVVAETGSGKTIVATEIIRQIIQQNIIWAGMNVRVCVRTYRMQGNVQVLFFVPSTALVDQQTRSLACYLRQVCTVHGLSGSDMIKSAFVHTS